MLKYLATILLTAFTALIFAQPDSVEVEMRGVWISTVKMLDYPSRRNLSSQALKDEYIKILDSLQKININAIFFQIRPAADAFFPSKYEPWSEWLTGKQGRAPDPYFDPLKFYINEAHKRNMQFHAWINPFRAVATVGVADVVQWHISNQKPEWFFIYGKHKYFNPGIPEVRNYITKIIADIVRRYDVDGIHFDDYFYPYPERNDKGRIIPIPDYQTYRKYGKDFNNIKDWRRNNITSFVIQVHDTIKSINPKVCFGISPNAVWRNKSHDPKGSNTRGLAAYDWLYADILKWDSLKVVDYIAPQLYFYIGHKYADYVTLLNWWSKNITNSDLFIGLNIHGIDPTGHNPHTGNPSQIPIQIRLARQKNNVNGFILYRAKSLLSNPLGIYDSLQNNLFKYKAIPPIYFTPQIAANITQTNKQFKSTIDTIPPAPPQSLDYYFINNRITVLWHNNLDTSNSTDITKYNLYVFMPQKKSNDTLLKIIKTSQDFVSFPAHRGWFLLRQKKYIFRVSALDSANNESRLSIPLKVRAAEIKL